MRRVLFIILLPATLLAQVPLDQNERLSNELAYNLNLYSGAYTQPVLERAPLLHRDWVPGAALSDPAWGLGLSLGVAFLQGPAEALSFNFNNLPFRNVELSDPSSPNLPTALGGSTNQDLIYTPTDENGNPYGSPVTGYLAVRVPAFSGMNLDGWLAYIRPQALIRSPYGIDLNVSLIPFLRVRGLQWADLGLEAVWHADHHFTPGVDGLGYGLSLSYQSGSFAYSPDFAEGNDQSIRLGFGSFGVLPHISYGSEVFRVMLRTGALRLNSGFSIKGTYSYQWVNSGIGPVPDEARFYVTDPVDISHSSWKVPVQLSLSVKTGSGSQSFMIAHAGQWTFGFNSSWKIF